MIIELGIIFAIILTYIGLMKKNTNLFLIYLTIEAIAGLLILYAGYLGYMIDTVRTSIIITFILGIVGAESAVFITILIKSNDKILTKHNYISYNINNSNRKKGYKES